MSSSVLSTLRCALRRKAHWSCGTDHAKIRRQTSSLIAIYGQLPLIHFSARALQAGVQRSTGAIDCVSRTTDTIAVSGATGIANQHPDPESRPQTRDDKKHQD